MLNLHLREIANHLGAELEGDDCMISDVSIDSRAVQSGDLYVAIRGDRFDGHDFIHQAEQAGAVSVLVEHPVALKLPQLIFRDSRLALAEIAGLWRNQLKVKVAGITGSNGKTTVKEMVASILSQKDEVLFTQGNFNNDIGVPLTLLRLNQEHRYAVIEMGANHQGEIAYTSRYAKPDVVVINNVSAAHIEGFGDLKGVAVAKGELIESLGDEGVAVINRDDDFYPYWVQLAAKRKTVTFGLHPEADVRADNIRVSRVGYEFVTDFELQHASEQCCIRLRLAGEHNVKNALAAAAVCSQFGVNLNQIRQGLERMKGVPGRLQTHYGWRGCMIIDDSYNANPASLKAGLEVVSQGPGEAWVVLGAFAELGENSQLIHKEMGELIRTMNIVRLLAIGSDARHTVNAFGRGATFFNSMDELIDELKRQIKGNETILIKGSRAQKMERVSAALVEKEEA